MQNWHQPFRYSIEIKTSRTGWKVEWLGPIPGALVNPSLIFMQKRYEGKPNDSRNVSRALHCQRGKTAAGRVRNQEPSLRQTMRILLPFLQVLFEHLFGHMQIKHEHKLWKPCEILADDIHLFLFLSRLADPMSSYRSRRPIRTLSSTKIGILELVTQNDITENHRKLKISASEAATCRFSFHGGHLPCIAILAEANSKIWL